MHGRQLGLDRSQPGFLLLSTRLGSLLREPLGRRPALRLPLRRRPGLQVWQGMDGAAEQLGLEGCVHHPVPGEQLGAFERARHDHALDLHPVGVQRALAAVREADRRVPIAGVDDLQIYHLGYARQDLRPALVRKPRHRKLSSTQHGLDLPCRRRALFAPRPLAPQSSTWGPPLCGHPTRGSAAQRPSRVATLNRRQLYHRTTPAQSSALRFVSRRSGHMSIIATPGCSVTQSEPRPPTGRGGRHSHYTAHSAVVARVHRDPG